jgi:hypothetical protein
MIIKYTKKSNKSKKKQQILYFLMQYYVLVQLDNSFYNESLWSKVNRLVVSVLLTPGSSSFRSCRVSQILTFLLYYTASTRHRGSMLIYVCCV